ncbi:DUF4349 domain-containing protein [Desulfosporosinus nitroreducens]|uniref:DUF4349 domain-containing protein n=1 Tax=Desulfosporosinus nitroreducens TaxID=2018668 RepID=UPI00207D5DFF|nr:DUF4349 domain-containing protein [Desulfosporosinus nitroreducens]MCO1603006.1 DUF4349 domain-containing protein [Desulfosporosinus nitroreducens]
MKRFFYKTDLTALWEEDGDLQRMKAFFQTIEGDIEGNEQIKQSVKQKALEKMASIEDSKQFHVDVNINEKESLAQRLRSRLLTMSNFGHWKLSLSVVALALFVIIGQEAMNGSLNIFPRMGSTQKLAQSVGSPPQAADSKGSMEMGADSNAKTKGVNDTFIANDEIAEAQSLQKDSLYSTNTSSDMRENVEIPPLSPDQPSVPPADTGVSRKIIHDLELTLEVATIKDTVTQISQEVKQLGGYVVTSQQSESDYHSSAQLTVKIPADKLAGLQDTFSAWGKVLEQRLQANDITNQYYDSQARLQILEAEEKRYLEILDKSTTIEDVLKVENSLSNVRQQIEQLKGQLKLWNHQVDYSTVTLQIVTRQSPNLNVTNPWQPISWSETWKAAGDAVLKTLSSTWNGLNYLVVGIGYASPYLLIGALSWILYRVWQKSKSQ